LAGRCRRRKFERLTVDHHAHGGVGRRLYFKSVIEELRLRCGGNAEPGTVGDPESAADDRGGQAGRFANIKVDRIAQASGDVKRRCCTAKVSTIAFAINRDSPAFRLRGIDRASEDLNIGGLVHHPGFARLGDIGIDVCRDPAHHVPLTQAKEGVLPGGDNRCDTGIVNPFGGGVVIRGQPQQTWCIPVGSIKADSDRAPRLSA